MSVDMADHDQILYGATPERETDPVELLERDIDDLEDLAPWRQYLHDASCGVGVARFLMALHYLDEDQRQKMQRAEHQPSDIDTLEVEGQAFDQLREAFSTNTGELLINPPVVAGAAAWRLTRFRMAKYAAMALAGEQHLNEKQFQDLAHGWLEVFGPDSLDEYRSGGVDG